MSRQSGKEPELWIKDVQQLLEFDRLLEIDRRVIQDYTQKGIVQPVDAATARGGRNTYGKIQITQLLAAKALSDRGMKLKDIANYFKAIRNTRTVVYKYTDKEQIKPYSKQRIQSKEVTYPAESVCFDPIPSETEVLEALWDKEYKISPPLNAEGWMFFWNDVYQVVSVSSWNFSHIIPQVIIPKYVSPTLGGRYSPAYYIKWRRYISYWLVWDTIRLEDMSEVFLHWTLDLARIKERVSRLLIDSEWYDSNTPTAQEEA